MGSSEIKLDAVSLEFQFFHENKASLKERFARAFRRSQPREDTSFLALNELSLSIQVGERVGIVGHNGAGKSTLLKTICGIYEPSKGSVQVKGQIAPLLEIGAGFQPELSGRQNIYLNGAILGYSKQSLSEIEAEVIAFTELGQFIDTPVKYYSTGMYMKLAFAIATAVHPDILILDELFAGGDAQFISKAEQRMFDFVDNSSILLFVTHQPELIRKLCNRVNWMGHGKIILDGEANLVLDKYLNSHATPKA